MTMPNRTNVLLWKTAQTFSGAALVPTRCRGAAAFLGTNHRRVGFPCQLDTESMMPAVLGLLLELIYSVTFECPSMASVSQTR